MIKDLWEAWEGHNISVVPPDFTRNLRIFETMYVGEAFSDRHEELYESMGNTRERWRLC